MTIHEDKDTKKNAMFKMKDCFYFRWWVEKPVGAMLSLVLRHQDKAALRPESE